VYRHRVFREPATAAAASAVLSRFVDQLATGRGHRDAPVGDDWRDNVGDYLADDVWTVFLVGGEQVAAWSDGELVVRCSGTWDQPLDDLPHARVPWSWLLVGLEDDRGGSSLGMNHPLTQALSATTVEDELIAWLEPVGVDSLSVSGILAASGPARRSLRKLPDQLLVRELIAPALLEGGGDQPALRHWWSQVLDRIGVRYTSVTGPARRRAPMPRPFPATTRNSESRSSRGTLFRKTCWTASAAPSSTWARRSTSGSATPALWVCPSPATTFPCT
jgi:hypothetical protein